MRRGVLAALSSKAAPARTRCARVVRNDMRRIAQRRDDCERLRRDAVAEFIFFTNLK
jgi:hypothetical protein